MVLMPYSFIHELKLNMDRNSNKQKKFQNQNYVFVKLSKIQGFDQVRG